MVKVDYSQIDLVPPIGAGAGLPISSAWMDVYSNAASPHPDHERWAAFDTGLWKDKFAHSAGTGSSKAQNAVVANVPKAWGANAQDVQLTAPDPTGGGGLISFVQKSVGNLIQVSPPRLNHQWGTIDSSQLVQVSADAFWSTKGTTNDTPHVALTSTELGRYVGLGRRIRSDNARPGNGSWNDFMFHYYNPASTPGALGYAPYTSITCDTNIGQEARPGTWTHNRLKHLTCTAHYSAVDYPSGGFGRQWGNVHDTGHQTSLACAAYFAADSGFSALYDEGGMNDAQRYASHWTVNLASFSRLTWSGATPSGVEGWRTPFGQASWVGSASLGEAETYIAGPYDPAETSITAQPDYAPTPSRTVQALAVYDQLSSIATDSRGANTPVGVHALGRADLGNSVVMDSAGLIGYDGNITVTAFGSITKNANSDGDDAVASKVYTTGQLYGGLNIQVHSGYGSARNEMQLLTGGIIPRFLYGSDGIGTEPMTSALKTSSARKINNGGSTTVWEETHDSNKTTFFNIRQTAGTSQHIGVDTAGTVGTFASLGRESASRLLGDDHQYGTSWDGTNKLTCAWMAEKIPTRVQVIPSVVGYVDVPVSPGSAKLTAYPAAADITFRKPIVDYHIIVSLIHENQLSNRTAELDPKTGVDGVNVGLMGTGSIPLSRNNPDPALLEFEAEYNEKPCEIWHGIVRINPQVLEQVYINPSHPEIATFNETDCPTMVLPRHLNLANCEQGWGLHQVTPFRPLANRTWSRVPRLCATVEAGGFYQHGGVSHIWDADVYGGELLVGADVMRTEDLSPSGLTPTANPEDGQNEWPDSIWGRGQISLAGSEDPHLPSGSELLIFKWTPEADAWYPGMTDTRLDSNPVQTQISDWIKAGTLTHNIISAEFATAYLEINDRAGFAITDENKLKTSCWDVNDWVFPQVELMAYLGQEDKGNMNSDGSTPLHPTLHCSALRIMEDGRMMMAAIHRDNIKSPYDMPSATIGNPYNPDTGGGQCPPGYYQQGGECKPILGSGSDDPGAGLVVDPITQQVQQPPAPISGGGGGQTSNTSVFGLVPSWSTLLDNTSARSLILLWTDAKAKEGRVVKGRCDFGLTWDRVADGTSTGQWVAKERWHIPDTWWSGARTSYWYPESGQRAIPITYGCYPETRLSYATLPRSLPWIDKDSKVQHGYPLRLTHDRMSQGPSAGAAFNSYTGRTGVDAYWGTRYNQLTIQRFIPTTPGFVDMGSGSNPHQELGRSGWSFVAGLFDPISYDPVKGGVGVTFSDDPEKLISTTLPRNNGAPFTGFSGFEDFTPDTAHNLNAVVYEFGAGITPSAIIEFNVAIPGSTTPMQTLIAPPLPYTTLPQFLIDLMNPTLCSLSSINAADYMPLQPSMMLYEYPFTLTGTVSATGFTILYDKQDGVFNPPTHDRLRWGELKYDDGTGTIVTITPTFVEHTGNAINVGGKSGWSHNGPLHYGSGTSGHPYRVDRIWSTVHGGLGYDLPLHLLAPGPVQVRARAGSSNSLDLEMETPFHRTDRLALEGVGDYYKANAITGFDLMGGLPGETKTSPLGQYYLRTNLWDNQSNHATNAPLALNPNSPHGPAGADTYLTPFWDDHPTDRFHAGAIPVNIGNDIDLHQISALRYPMPNILNSDEWSILDAVALSEQLQSSVDVHVSKTVKPFWDSGSIITAQGAGYSQSDPYAAYAARNRQLMSGDVVPASVNASGLNWASSTRVDYGLGHGQRILRTPDGTLHTFSQRRSAQVPLGSQLFLPCYEHFKKPPFSDMFFNRKSLTTNPATDTYSGKDEVHPIMQGAESSLYTHTRLCGAAFATDSNGTIHAVFEVSSRSTMASSKSSIAGTSNTPAHNLYYTYAKRILVSTNPEPVYDWDWTEAKAIFGGYGGQVVNPNANAVGVDDLRQPTLVCDAEDRLHLACTRVVSGDASEIWYSSKLEDDAQWPLWSVDGSIWQKVSLTDADGTNTVLSGPHSTANCDFPKLCLRGDGVPVVFYRGASNLNPSSDRNTSAVYVNTGKAGQQVNDPSGRFKFDETPYTCGGLPPYNGVHSTAGIDVNYYDAIVDERDRAYVVATKNASYGAGTTTLTTFSTRLTLESQYTVTEGLGSCRTIYYIRAATGHDLSEPTLTTDGQGNIHLVMGHHLSASDANWFGKVMRDVSGATDTALWPIQWPGLASGDYSKGSASGPGDGGFGGLSTDTKFPIGGVGPGGTVPVSGAARHLIEMWWPSLEFDHDLTATDMVLRSLNVRWLSVPSLSWDTTNGWQPISSAQTMAGHEDFPHYGAQLRYQRFWGFSAADLDMMWLTNELSWLQTMHEQSRVMHPYGMSAMYGFFSETEEGIGIPAYYS